MTTSDLKLDIIKLISVSKDITLLKEIKIFFALEEKDENIYAINPYSALEIYYKKK